MKYSDCSNKPTASFNWRPMSRTLLLRMPPQPILQRTIPPPPWLLPRTLLLPIALLQWPTQIHQHPLEILPAAQRLTMPPSPCSKHHCKRNTSKRQSTQAAPALQRQLIPAGGGELPLAMAAVCWLGCSEQPPQQNLQRMQLQKLWQPLLQTWPQPGTSGKSNTSVSQLQMERRRKQAGKEQEQQRRTWELAYRKKTWWRQQQQRQHKP